ncbi:peptidoglycan recognition family protein [Ruminococcus sp.]|uniref:peptidoglycan recognition protein family protein n=1 Tax=Ruminococcus sp. TaxID=41978 RepID=UPI001B5DD844|nr:peptidoglycan recognition family protein [Ruminococcus sp.]MBP5432676.1 N-acetylmuramoyl-L-alanine amidase [Ruminococcus sp.]
MQKSSSVGGAKKTSLNDDADQHTTSSNITTANEIETAESSQINKTSQTHINETSSTEDGNYSSLSQEQQMPDVSEDRDSGNGESTWKGDNETNINSGSGNFIEENIELIKKIKNILDFVYHESNISISELIIAAKEIIKNGNSENTNAETVISDTYLIKNNKSYFNPEKISPKGICIYASGAVMTAIDMINKIFNIMYIDAYENIAVHAIINYEDGKIYQTLPWNFKGNHNFSEMDNSYIGIVICEADHCTLENDPMADTFNTLAALVAWICNAYSINPNEDKLIVQTETGLINDISSYWQGVYTKEDFLTKVQEIMNNGISTEKLKENYYAT